MKKFLTVVLMLMFTSCSVVGPGQKGVSVYFGKVTPGVLDSGTYMWVPFIRSVKKIGVRVNKSDTKTEASSKDMQNVTAEVAINWHLDPSQVDKVFQNVGDEDDIVTNIISPAVSEVLKSSTAKMTAEEILTKRIELKNNIDSGLLGRLKNYNVLVDDVSLVNLNFTAEFNTAVEQKQVAEQHAKRAEYEAQQATVDAKAAVNKAHGVSQSNIEVARGEAEAMLTKATAEAKSKMLLQKSITPEILQLEYYKRWDGKQPNVLITSGKNNPSLLINVPHNDTKDEE